MSVDSPKGPCNGDGCRKVSFRGGESVSGCSSFKEEQSQKHKDLGPDTGRVVASIDTECLEGSQDNENRGPAVVQGEGEVDESLVESTLRGVMLLDDVVDVL